MPTNPSGISERERQRRDRQRRLSRILREQEMLTYVGLKKSQVAEMIKRGEFPGPLKLSETGRAKGWLEDELADWQARRIAARDAA